jgi:hypothetical protein
VSPVKYEVGFYIPEDGILQCEAMCMKDLAVALAVIGRVPIAATQDRTRDK